MPFLDVLIRISTNNNIITDMFSKDTDTLMYLNFRSSNPKHIKINIPTCSRSSVCIGPFSNAFCIPLVWMEHKYNLIPFDVN
jgi:hypothetical protein